MRSSQRSGTTTTTPPSSLPNSPTPHAAAGYSNDATASRTRTRLFGSSSTNDTSASAGGSGKKSAEDGATQSYGRASGARKQERSQAPLGPPVDPELFQTDEDWKRYHHQEEKVSGWHHLPLVLVALPPLGAVIHGRAENWTDGMILILVCFYLYHLVRVPWDIYYASRSRRILTTSIGEDQEEVEEDPTVVFMRRQATHQLAKSELISLLMTIVTPITGAYLLYLARGILSDPERYINTFTISLFALATSVKPLLHLAELFKRRSLFYQEAVHYPSTQVHLLQRKIDRMEKDLSQLNRAFATKEEVRLLRDGVDVPLTQLSKAVRRYERKEEYSRLTSEERFALLDAKLDDAMKESAMNAELIQRLKREHDESSNPLTTLLRVINHLLGLRHQEKALSSSGKQLRWFERGPFFYLFLPVNVSTMAVEWVATKATSDDGSWKGPGLEARPARVAFANGS